MRRIPVRVQFCILTLLPMACMCALALMLARLPRVEHDLLESPAAKSSDQHLQIRTRTQQFQIIKDEYVSSSVTSVRRAPSKAPSAVRPLSSSRRTTSPVRAAHAGHDSHVTPEPSSTDNTRLKSIVLTRGAWKAGPIGDADDGDTLVYLGSDLDVSVLGYLQPWETRIVFFDSLRPTDAASGDHDRLDYFEERAEERKARAMCKDNDTALQEASAGKVASCAAALRFCKAPNTAPRTQTR